MLAVVRQNLLELALRATKRSHSVLRNKAKKVVVFVEGENRGKTVPLQTAPLGAILYLVRKKKLSVELYTANLSFVLLLN